MATVLIIATDHLIGGLLGQLTDLAGHAAQFGRANEAPIESVRQTQPDLVMLDAAYGGAAMDAIAAAATDVGAPVVYFAAALPATELRRFALERRAKYFALPAGPKLLRRVLASALTADAATAGEISSARYAVVAAIAAVGRARMLAERAADLRSTTQTLRAEYESLLADCRRSAAELREAIIMYTRELRASGVPPDQALQMVRETLRSEIHASNPTPDIGGELDDATEWCLQAYYAA